MRPVLAYHLDLAGKGGGPANPEELIRLVGDWVGGWYRRKALSLPDSLAGGVWHEPMRGHLLRSSLAEVNSAQGNWELGWEYPSDDDETVLWRTDVRIAWEKSGTDIGVVLSVASRDFVVRPFRYEVYAPKAIATLLERFRCSVRGRPVTAKPMQVSRERVQEFVDSALLAQDRGLPVVLVSRVHGSNDFLVDPNAVAVQLGGLADVWALNDKWTAFDLTRIVGARHSCFDGAVRVFWPGFRRDSNPYDHPLLLRSKLEFLQRRGEDPVRQVFRLVAPVAGFRHTDSVRFLGNRAQHAIAERAKQESVIAQATREELEAQALAQIQVEYDLKEKVAALEKDKQGLAEELAAVRQNYKQMQLPTGDGAEQIAGSGGERGEPESVRQALDWAAEDHAVLLPWDSAYASADRSDFARPDEVLHALAVLAHVAERYFDQKRTGKAMGRLEDLFEAEGIRYAPMDAQNTTNQYGKDRTFSQDGEKVMFKRHLTLGGGDRKNCIQVYFEFEDSAGFVNIGYCGMHLPYYGMRS